MGIEILSGQTVVSTSGRLRVSSMTVMPLAGGTKRAIAVDALLMSSGWTPSVHLFSQSRGKVAWDSDGARFLPGDYVQDCVSVGTCGGTDGLEDVVTEAVAAGRAMAEACGHKSRARAPKIKVTAAEDWSGGIVGAAPGGDVKGKAFVDFQNDVTTKDIRLAVREGMHSIEHVKRFTTNGMATDQGKTSNMHGLAIAAEALGRDIPEVGLTTFRTPYTPVTFGALVNHARGELFDVTRRMSATGNAPGTIPDLARTCTWPSTGSAEPFAMRQACSMPRLSARSKSWVPMPQSS
jgi:sarcosine oxidase subunit alpha